MQTLIKWWKRRGLAAPHVIAWRLLWVAPLMLAGWVFVLCVFMSYGNRNAARTARDMDLI